MREQDWGLDLDVGSDVVGPNEGWLGVGTSDKPKDKKPENVKSRKPVRK